MLELFTGERKRRAAPRGKRASTIVSTPLEGGRPVDGEMVMCCHCGRHWLWQEGSGNLRGFCMNCKGYTCGPGCETCVPVQQLIENIEAGMPWEVARLHKPITVSRGGILIPGE